MSGLVGRRLGRYEVLSLLGAGGMGEVYRARDTELERDVAVKVLPDAASGDPAWLDRFRREAHALSRLSHPNILEIFDAGSDDGVRYVVTELLEGRTLRDHLEHGRLPIRKAVAIADAIARGLGAAHAQGVVHRDVKPENVLLTSDGRVKVLDFGIARLHELEAAAARITEAPTVTSAGTLLGTIGYMAPEQIRGEPADARSDVFALGCVLYEMLTGQRAFERATPAATLAAMLHDDPESPGALVPDLPSSLGRVVMRCLEKQPGERFQSAADVAFALRASEESRGSRTVKPRTAQRRSVSRLLAVAALGAIVVVAAGVALRHAVVATPRLPDEKHVAVMSFGSGEDSSDLKEATAGVTEVVAQGLSLLEQESHGRLWFVPPCEAARLDANTAQQVHRTFNVTLAVTGLLRQSGDSLSLDLAVVDPETMQQLAHTRIEDSVSNLSSFQEEPVMRLAHMLDVEVSPEVRARLSAQSTTLPEAFQSYIRGVGILATSPDGPALDRAIGLLETTTRTDPVFAAGHVELAEACLQKSESTGSQEWSDRALAEATRAAGRHPAPESAYRVLARVHRARGEAAQQLAVLERAAQLIPSSPEILLDLADANRVAGHLDDAERNLQRAIYLRPGYWPSHDQLGKLYLDQGKYEAAATEFREVITCAPELTRGYNNLGTVLFYLGRNAEARLVFERSLAIAPSRSALSNLGNLYFESARYADAAHMFERALEEDDSRYLTWGNLGFAYKFVPAPEEAEKCFRRAVELAEKAHESSPHDLWAAVDLADYYAMLGNRQRGRQLIAQVVAEGPTEPQLIAQVAEVCEDLGDRERALEWVARALHSGVPSSRFENRPNLRELVADPSFRELVEQADKPV